MGDEKPSVLVIGGTGFIGKHLVKYLVDYQIASKIRVVDKRLPQMSHMDADFTATFGKVEFVQADVATSAAKAWGDQAFNIVVNLASAMEFGKPDAWYEMNILKARQECAKIAAQKGCDKYLEVSTTTVYKPLDEKGSKAAKEGDAEAPGNIVGRMHLEAERWVLANCPQLPVIIARLPVVYGPADVHGLMPRLLCAASYIGTDEKMQLLYSDDLRVHTLHVQDAVGCMWFLLCSGEEREVYNVCDDNDTTQKKLNKILEEVFPVKAECVGHQTSKIAIKAEGGVGELVKDANEEHGENWMKLCQKHGAEACGPLTTYLDVEDLNGRPNSVSNAKSKAAGYQYTVPQLTAEYVRHAVQYWHDVKGKCFFPRVLRG